MSARTLADRLAEIRAARSDGGRPSEPAPTPAMQRNRADVLARWFGAHLEVAGGCVVVVERHVTLPPDTLAALDDFSGTTYFDTETTGLSTGAGTVVFLAGSAFRRGEQLVVRQLLLPDYPHEPALLRQVTAILRDRPRLVTYNGRGFDLPLLRARLTVNGLFRELAALPQAHDDLLPPARRLFRRAIGGARLALVEAEVLGVRRSSDCPSSEVPDRYFSYLRGGSPDLLAAVLDHNFQDVVSLALLDARIAQLVAGGWREAPMLDRRGMALELLRRGATDAALELAESASDRPMHGGEDLSLRRLATRMLLGAGHVERAEALWAAGTRRASADAARAWIEVARIRERHRGDLHGALEAVVSAQRVLDLAFALGRGGSLAEVGAVRLRVDARLRRLRRWTAAAERRMAATQRGMAGTGRPMAAGSKVA